MPGIRRKSKDREERIDSKSGSRSPRRNKTVLQVGIHGNRNKSTNEPLISPSHSHESSMINDAANYIGNDDKSSHISTSSYTSGRIPQVNTLSYSNSDDQEYHRNLYNDMPMIDQNYHTKSKRYSDPSSETMSKQGLASLLPTDEYSQSHASNTFQESTPTKSNKTFNGSQASKRAAPIKSQWQQEPEIVDAIYEEKYGEKYVDKPIRYIYPHGYGSMRPRSWPWKISIVSTIVFAWLNVFIVGHCSDRYELNYYKNDDQYQANYMDDNAVKIETRWCGSQTLYFMWVLSVMITGLSCAYCSIIGYVKARDFAVGNGRSQPPGMAGNSDYYVQMENGSIRFEKATDKERNSKSRYSYRKYQSGGDYDGTGAKIIYQSDGTPRFFGGKIYHPNQAAVNMTSR